MIITRLSELLALTYPIVSAPMARMSGGELASAVSIAGGLGTFGGVHPYSAPIEIDYVRENIAMIRDRTDRPFGVGFITQYIEYFQANFDLVLAENVPVVLLSFADPRPWLGKIKANGALAICQVQTFDAARIAVEEGADVLAIQGNEAGGHCGDRNLLPFLTQALDAFPDTPMIAAGGIAAGRSFAAVLAAGGDGAWIGTAFQAVAEAAEVPAADRDMVLASDGQDSIRNSVYDLLGEQAYGNLPWPDGIAMRTRKNTFLERWIGRTEELQENIEDVARVYAEGYASGDPNVTPFLFGESAAFVNAVEPAEVLMKRICTEAEVHLRRGAERICA